jgi:ElaB/YqjD/DUF883 family membrane-anchored ribosome-binding protein
MEKTMSNNAYGNLGNEMKAMQDGRKNLMAEIKDSTSRIRVQSGQTLAAARTELGETSKANGRLASQTRQMLTQAGKELKDRTRETLAQADQMVAAIRKDVAALKADAGEILCAAGGFLAQTSSDNARLKVQTHKMLSHARIESKSQAREVLTQAGAAIAQTKVAVAGVKAQTGRILADATGVMKQLSEASRQRAVAWRDILHSLHSGAIRPATQRLSGAATGKSVHKAAPKRTKTGGKQTRKTA